MDIRLTPEDLELQERARDFTERVLIPLELECEEHDGLSAESLAAAKQAVLDAGFNAINHAEHDGGRGLDVLQQIVVEEQWGNATNALWDIPWRPSIPLANATAEQKERYHLPQGHGDRLSQAGIGSGHDRRLASQIE